MPVETRLISTRLSGESEPKIFTGKNTLIAELGRETPEATIEWLRFYQIIQDTEAAVIVAHAGQRGFARSLSDLAPDIPVVVLHSEEPIGDRTYEVLCGHLLSETAAVASFAFLILPCRARVIRFLVKFAQPAVRSLTFTDRHVSPGGFVRTGPHRLGIISRCFRGQIAI